VGGAAVELDHEPLLAPQAVHLETPIPDGERDVELGQRQAAFAEEGQEPVLELAAGDGVARGRLAEDLPQGREPATAWVPSEQLRQ
jgi:hypothetical protein